MKHLFPSALHKSAWYLLFLSLIFFFLRLPSLIEPYWYGDEGIYEVIGQALRHGRILYTGIWDNKPPMLYLMYALFNGDQFAVRVLSLIFGLFALVTLYFLTEKLFHSHRISVISTFFFLFLFGIPTFEGNIANAENFMLFPIILALLLIKTATEKKIQNNRRFLFFAGLFLGIAFLYKIVAVFDLAAGVFFLLLQLLPDNLRSKKTFILETLLMLLKRVLPVLIGFSIPIIITVLYFVLHHALGDFLTATFLSNIGYVGYKNQFLFPQGLLVTKLLILGIILTIIFLKRKHLDAAIQLILIWLSFSLFNALFSQRPYTHYTLVLLPAASLLVAAIAATKKKQQKALCLLFIILGFLVYSNFGIYSLKKSVLYYENFSSFITGKKSTTAYQSFFDRNVPRDYAIASYITTHTRPSDKIFLWGNDAQIYARSNKIPIGKYTVAYHIEGSKLAIAETNKQIAEQRPRFIIVLSDAKSIPIDLQGYTYRMTIENSIVYETVY